ncbi:acyltransferase family protein [Paenibacillus oleatilyticus]|uniref:acyltransferase family protein n=1 Tax=Paenibacillus oleatilyticus TaxID=2594886 RepID=UPI001C200691|nr:acyltransferase family protein [Paenibacillus oleatilyticus]MBU7319738.1 acyltransferase family protein [Paenibacillus oleatilyticus]
MAKFLWIITFFLALLIGYSYLYITFPQYLETYNIKALLSLSFFATIFTPFIFKMFLQIKNCLTKKHLYIFILILSLLVAIGINKISLNFPKKTSIEIIATGTQNALSKGTEVWIKYFEIDNKEIALKNFELPPNWELIRETPVSYKMQPSIYRWDGYIKNFASIGFTSHPYSGNVEIAVNGVIQKKIDLYSNNEHLQFTRIEPSKYYSFKSKIAISGFCLFACIILLYLYVVFQHTYKLLKNKGLRYFEQANLPNQPKQGVQEIYILRAVSCLSIVIIHILSSVYTIGADISPFKEMTLQTLQIILMFGTPAFTFMSEFITSYTYKNNIPKHFLKKRFLFIFTPYIVTSILYGVIISLFSESFIGRFITYLGNFEFISFFILVIFQFYIFHIFFVKYIIKRYSTKSIIISTFSINFLYLLNFNLINPPEPNASFIWKHYDLLLLAWIFYFVLGYYGGIYYKEVKYFINKNINLIIFCPVLTALTMLFFHWNNTISILSSKRIDILFYTITVIIVLFYLADVINQRLKKVLIWISSYSIGIYFLQPFFIFISNVTTKYYFSTLRNTFLVEFYILSTFVFTISGSIFVLWVANKWKIGKYMFGKINKIK